MRLNKTAILREVDSLITEGEAILARKAMILNSPSPLRVKKIRCEYVSKQMNDLNIKMLVLFEAARALVSAGLWGRSKNVKRQRSVRQSILPQAIESKRTDQGR